MLPKKNSVLLGSLPDKLHKICEKMRPRSGQSYAEVLKKFFLKFDQNLNFGFFNYLPMDLIDWTLFDLGITKCDYFMLMSH